MQEQAKRRGRPIKKDKTPTTDMHLTLPTSVVDKIDAIIGETGTRQGYILKVLLAQPEIGKEQRS